MLFKNFTSLTVRSARVKSIIVANKQRRWVQRMVRKQLLEGVAIDYGASPVVALCTAESYNFSKLVPYLQTRYSVSPPVGDVAHVYIPNPNGEPTDIFFFGGSGSFVTWGPPDTGSFLLNLREDLRPFEINPTRSVESEEMSFRVSMDGNETTGIRGETIVIADQSDVVKIKLAFSNGLSDSVKISLLETVIDNHINKVRQIPLMLQNKEKIKLSRKEVLALTGQLLHFRALLNLDSEIIDPPDYYWEEPYLENLYIQMSRFLETRQRVSVLNKKLDYVNELTNVLRSELSERHGLKLEWGIIILISIEVLFGLLEWAEKLGFLIV